MVSGRTLKTALRRSLKRVFPDSEKLVSINNSWLRIQSFSVS